MIIQGDITPAIKELQKIYAELKAWGIERDDKFKQYGYGSHNSNSQMVNIPAPVISVAPKSRRNEDGWFKPGAWNATKNTQAVNILGGQQQKQQSGALDEVYIAGESLNQTAEEIVLNVLHQLIHQVAFHRYERNNNQQSKSYHNSWFASVARRFGIAPIRENSGGYGNLDPNVCGHSGEATKRLKEIALKVNMKAFDIFRQAQAQATAAVPTGGGNTGRMKLWHCTGCPSNRRAKLRTGKLIDMTCNKCGTKVVYADKDRHDPNIQHRLQVLNIGWLP